MMMIARLMKNGSLKRPSIKNSSENVGHGEQDENETFIGGPHQTTASVDVAPSRSGRTIRFSFMEETQDSNSTATQNSLTVFRKMAKRPSIPDTWWISYYLQKKSEMPPPRIVLRSDKHDYRNPDSNYSDEIVDSLRQKLLEETEELDLQHRLNPFLSKDFLKSLQQFGLFPEPEDEEEEEDEELIEQGTEWNEEEEEGDEEEMRRRTMSDASHLRLPSTTMRISSDENLKSKTKNLLQVVNPPVAGRGNSMDDNVNRANISRRPSNVAHHMTQTRKKLFQKRFRRWTITSISLRSLQRATKRTLVIQFVFFFLILKTKEMD